MKWIKKYRDVALVIAITAAPMASRAVTFEHAMLLYMEKHYEHAYQAFTDLAEIGNGSAQFNLAVMHVRGEHVEKDLTKGLAWAYIAQQNDAPPAQSLIDTLTNKLSADEVEQAQQESSRLHKTYSEEAIKTKFLPVQTTSASAFAPAKIVFSARPAYPRIMAKRGRAGWVDLQFMVGKDGTVRYYHVLQSSGDAFSEAALETIAKNRYQPSRAGVQPAMQIGSQYRYIFQLSGTELKKEKLNSMLDEKRQEAEEGGSTQKLSYFLALSGWKSALNHAKGYEEIKWDDSTPWLVEAAQYGSALAQYQLGLNVLQGKQCEVDTSKSLLWLERAASGGLLDAKLAIGYELLTGVRMQKNVDLGFELIKETADKGLNHAQALGAWLLATYPEQKYRDLERAERYLNELEQASYADQRSLKEALVAVALVKQNWRKAKKRLKELSKLNASLKVSDEREKALKTALKNKTPYVEEA